MRELWPVGLMSAMGGKLTLRPPPSHAAIGATDRLALDLDKAAVFHVLEQSGKPLASRKAVAGYGVGEYRSQQLLSGTCPAVFVECVPNELIEAAHRNDRYAGTAEAPSTPTIHSLPRCNLRPAF